MFENIEAQHPVDTAIADAKAIVELDLDRADPVASQSSRCGRKSLEAYDTVVVTKQTQILAQPAADLQHPSTRDVIPLLEIEELLEDVNAISRVTLEEIDVVVDRAGLRPSDLPTFAVARERLCVHLRLGHDRIVGR
jgi:hypothetical protein